MTKYNKTDFSLETLKLCLNKLTEDRKKLEHKGDEVPDQMTKEINRLESEIKFRTTSIYPDRDIDWLG
jgi:lipid II:glycine glycyltransferase (peptidoglycan interpeptide bridge formation enzyme)